MGYTTTAVTIDNNPHRYKNFAQFKFLGTLVYYLWYQAYFGDEEEQDWPEGSFAYNLFLASSALNGTVSLEPTMLTAYDAEANVHAEYPYFVIHGTKIYVGYEERTGSPITSRALGVGFCDLDGTGWTQVSVTGTDTYNEYVCPCSAGTKVAFLWMKRATAAGNSTIVTASMDADGTNWSATDRTTATTVKYPCGTVYNSDDSKVYMAWRDHVSASRDDIYFAKMDPDGANFTSQQMTSDVALRSVAGNKNIFIYGNRLYLVYGKKVGSYYQVTIGSSALDLTDWTEVVVTTGTANLVPECASCPSGTVRVIDYNTSDNELHTISFPIEGTSYTETDISYAAAENKAEYGFDVGWDTENERPAYLFQTRFYQEDIEQDGQPQVMYCYRTLDPLTIGSPSGTHADPDEEDDTTPPLDGDYSGPCDGTAYQFIVYDEYGNTIWDSGKTAQAITDGANVAVNVPAGYLRCGGIYYWKWRAWDCDDNALDWSEAGWFKVVCGVELAEFDLAKAKNLLAITPTGRVVVLERGTTNLGEAVGWSAVYTMPLQSETADLIGTLHLRSVWVKVKLPADSTMNVQYSTRMTDRDDGQDWQTAHALTGKSGTQVVEIRAPFASGETYSGNQFRLKLSGTGPQQTLKIGFEYEEAEV